MSQLALPLKLDDHAVFASFWPVGNAAVADYVRQLADGSDAPGAYLFGPPAAGKSHLLQAACAAAGDRAVFLPLATLAAAGPQILEGVASRPLVCIDDIDRVARDAAWETALFALWHELADARGRLLASARASLRETGFALPDLASRLSELAPFQLKPVADGERAAALQHRARYRGLELPDETARYLLARSRRDMASLYGLLDRLEREALEAGRRLTVPFVREVLGA